MSKRILLLGHTGKMGIALKDVFAEDYDVIAKNSSDFDALDFKQTQIQVDLGDGSYRWTLKYVLFTSLEYDSKIDAQDVRLAWSMAQYNTSQFAECVSNIRIIRDDADISGVFEPDISTVQGRNKIAKELEKLQLLLSS